MDPNSGQGQAAVQRLFETLVTKIAANTELLGMVNANLVSFRTELKEFSDNIGPLVDNTGTLGDSVDDLWAMFNNAFTLIDRVSSRQTNGAVSWRDVAEALKELHAESAAAAKKNEEDADEEEEEEAVNEIFPPRQ